MWLSFFVMAEKASEEVTGVGLRDRWLTYIYLRVFWPGTQGIGNLSSLYYAKNKRNEI